MSVQQEPLKMSQTTSEKKDAHGHVNEPPKLEFANSSESLEAFGAALGGAILGVLATLLILAIINMARRALAPRVWRHWMPKLPALTRIWAR